MVWVLFAIAVVIVASALVAVIGAVLPARHTISRKALFNLTPQELWDVVTDFPAQVSWRGDLGHVERLPRRGARPVWREVDRRGQAITLETVESLAPRRLVRRVTDNRMFGGDWTYEIDAYGEVTSLTVTENGEVYNPIVRFISRFIMGQASTTDNYLRALGQKLGSDVTITSA